MSGLEALMWRLGRADRRFLPTMSLVVELGDRLDEERLRRRLALLCAAVPRLRDRVREPAAPFLPPAWEPDPAFSLDHHLAAAPLAGGDPWTAAADVLGAGFAEGRPPWMVTRTNDGAAVILHLHHSYTDGLGGVRLIGELFDFGPGRGAGADPGASVPPPPPPSSVLDDVAAEVGHVLGLWSRYLPWAARSVSRALARPGEVLDQLASVAAEMEPHARAAVGPASPVLRSRSAEAVVAPLALSLDGLRAAGRRLGVTVNDVFLAALLDGLERYHAKHGSRAPSVRLGVPISRRDGGPGMHNQLVAAVMRGPLGDLDFAERSRLVHEMVLLGRRQPWADLLDRAAGAGARFPGALPAVAALLGSLDVLASNVIGPPAPMWLAGAPVTSLTPVGPRSGAAINATLMSFGTAAGVGLNIDPVAVPDPGVLLDCLTAAFDEALTV
jgi:diacylglycerol O-acyltransferase